MMQMDTAGRWQADLRPCATVWPWAEATNTTSPCQSEETPKTNKLLQLLWTVRLTPTTKVGNLCAMAPLRHGLPTIGPSEGRH